MVTTEIRKDVRFRNNIQKIIEKFNDCSRRRCDAAVTVKVKPFPRRELSRWRRPLYIWGRGLDGG